MQLFAKLQLVKAEMRDIVGEHVTARQELEETQAELTREHKYKSVTKCTDAGPSVSPHLCTINLYGGV